MTLISVARVDELIKAQRDYALQSPIMVFSDVARDAVKSVGDQFCEVYHNPGLISYHSPQDANRVLAESVHRTAVFFFFKSGSVYQRKWFEEVILPSLEDLHIIDSYMIDMAKATTEETKKMKEFGVTQIPCVFVYRMGHRVDTILPETENTLIADQIAEYRRVTMNNVDTRAILDYSKEGLKNDDDRLAFEQRARNKDLSEKRKQQQDDVRYRMEVRRKIEENNARRKALGK